MRQMYYEKRVPKFHRIYLHIREDPYIAIYDAAKKEHMSRTTVSRYLQEMYNLSILAGPGIFVNPAKNYHQYVYFLQFEDPLSIYTHSEELSFMLFRSVEFGDWNSLIITDKMMDFSSLKGFKRSFFQGSKGLTHFSAVVSLDWDACLQAMYDAAAPPRKKSSLYQEIPKNPWDTKEWILYQGFKKNIRITKKYALQKFKIRYPFYQDWMRTLSQYAEIQTAFYPQQLDHFFAVDFLFESEYHTQLKDILGMLPSTSIFFSVGTHLLARLFYSSKKEKEELLTFILWLRKKGYYTNVYNAAVISSIHEDKGVIMV
ncbi:MAG: winged helix-turn-helix domain-containing protein [Candidatus Methanofastidiosia archaeon]|jgi:hypothetical protein